jgi:hypothetical protein
MKLTTDLNPRSAWGVLAELVESKVSAYGHVADESHRAIREWFLQHTESLHLRLRQRTLLVLLTRPVPRHAPRLVHRQRHGHEQHQQAASGVDHQ